MRSQTLLNRMEKFKSFEHGRASPFAGTSFTDVGWKAIRKRNSKKELFEYVVHAVAP